jgi:hypothetical protein
MRALATTRHKRPSAASPALSAKENKGLMEKCWIDGVEAWRSLEVSKLTLVIFRRR